MSLPNKKSITQKRRHSRIILAGKPATITIVKVQQGRRRTTHRRIDNIGPIAGGLNQQVEQVIEGVSMNKSDAANTMDTPMYPQSEDAFDGTPASTQPKKSKVSTPPHT
jgi:hypothetical protein